MDRLVVVGSGTVVPEGDRGGSCYYVELGATRTLLDCGPGAVQSLARFGLPWADLTDLILTHFHADHVGAVPGLLFSLRYGLLPAHRSGPLDVWGPPGTRSLWEGLASALGSFVREPGFPVRLHELEPGAEARLEGGIRLSMRETPHTPESCAVKLEAGGIRVGYTGDTGPCDELGSFLRGARVLVCECSLTDEEAVDNHLSPGSVARIAARAAPERLLLTHVYPHVRATRDVVALVRAAGYTEGEVELATDGLAVPLSR
ncbi:MAG: MBL fold metallo-hydrolase [Gemmatimonadota bacterium]